LLYLALLGSELRWPLRPARESKGRRQLRNFAVAALGGLTVGVLQQPFTAPLARRVLRQRQGLLQQLPVPEWARDALAVVLMDYTLYLWHVLTHEVPHLWRFHRVHHADLDLDASTAVRFHVGELALSVPYRLAQVRLLGVSPRALDVWQRLLMLSILFHHANVRLPERLERVLSTWVMTPRLHGIHHSADPEESSSNWSSGLALWDWLHGTLRRDVAQEDLDLGIPEPHRPEQLTLPRLLALPWRPPATPGPTG
jgi:sterol desaturase/sphingolipid hydroxylase (fatty acid hydroxylase superfamily)